MFLPKVNLLPQELLVRTSPVDHADWNYRPVLGKLQRVRFQLIKALLGNFKGSDILEVGYGSGVFFPELLQSAERIAGIDPHTMHREVVESLKKANIEADLRSGSVSDMDFADDSFDCVVAVSALEYVEEIDDACQQIIRVLRDGGSLILVTPGKSPVLDLGLKLMGGEDADSNYGDRREKLLAALSRHFDFDAVKRWPWPGIPWFTVYRALRLTPKRGAASGAP
jgi:SAM-dependent methyltransferase